MDKDQKNVNEFMDEAGQEVHTKLRIPSSNERILRSKLILEEALETINAMGVMIECTLTDGCPVVTEDNVKLHDIGDVDIVEVADGCADNDYINNGTATTFGIDLEPVKAEVHSSNMSKFIDGYRRDDGKWVKGPSYTPANIARVLLEQCDNVTQDELDALDIIESDGAGLELAMSAAKKLLNEKLNNG